MTPFDPSRLWLDDLPLGFLAEVAFRAALIYLVVFMVLRIAGRRGVRQLSLFELVIILTLGSAAGDVSFYDDVPLLPVAMVFIVIICLYRFTTWLKGRSPRIEVWLEGHPLVIIRDGVFDIKVMRAENISNDEFFMELRRSGVEHLGQVRLGILELDGDLSLFFFDDASVRPGLPLLPDSACQATRHPEYSGQFACSHCGNLAMVAGEAGSVCQHCDGDRWITPLRTLRHS